MSEQREVVVLTGEPPDPADMALINRMQAAIEGGLCGEMEKIAAEGLAPFASDLIFSALLNATVSVAQRLPNVTETLHTVARTAQRVAEELEAHERARKAGQPCVTH